VAIQRGNIECWSQRLKFQHASLQIVFPKIQPMLMQLKVRMSGRALIWQGGIKNLKINTNIE
jgi:hypothetical protein